MTHIPVLLNEVLEAAHDLKISKIFDGTFGRGGHLAALMQAFPESSALAFDRDPDAISYGQTKFVNEVNSGKLQIVHSDFRSFEKDRWGEFDFMLLDLGVSSPQLDLGERGFSFYHDGPLDMRMNISEGQTAADILNESSEETLVQIFQGLGEVRKPYRVVRAIVHDRKESPWQSTKLLASMIERVEGWRTKGHHPATQYFMALRMAVNSELDAVQIGLRQCISGLKEGGRLAVISFHSLEDRIVKQIFRGETSGFCVNKKVIQGSEEEVKINSRARSAKLRIFQKGIRDGKSKKFSKELD